MLKLLAGLAIALFITSTGAIFTVQMTLEASRPLVEAPDLAKLDLEALPRNAWVKSTLRFDQVHATVSGTARLLTIDATGAWAQLSEKPYQQLQREGRFELLGYLQPAFRIPGVKDGARGVVDDPAGFVTWRSVVVSAVLTLLSAFGAGTLINGWRRGRRASETTLGAMGLFEKLGQRYPEALARLSRVSINGFGVHWLDFHDLREDGSAVATQWVRVAFFPLGPVRRARIRVLSQHETAVPFVVQVGSMRYEELEQLSVDAKRNGRLYGFYYGLVAPLMFVPFFAGFATMVALDFKVSAAQFWLGALAALSLGVGAVFLERRTMGPPRRRPPAV